MAHMTHRAKTALSIAAVAVVALAFATSFAATTQVTVPDDPTIPEVHITRDGKVVIQGLKIMQRINTTFFARTIWDDSSFIRWTIKTSAGTDIRKRYGETIQVSEIKDGDYVYAEGVIEGGSGLSINATKIINWSDFTAQSTMSGTIKTITAPSQQFTLLKSNKDLIEVFLNATTSVRRNKFPISAGLLKIGDVVQSIEGTYDSSAKNILAQKITTYINPEIFKSQNYQGILQTAPAGDPASFTLKIDGKNYTVQLSSDAIILNRARQIVTFSRWLVGDTVRVYGNIREDSDYLDTISASIARDINF